MPASVDRCLERYGLTDSTLTRKFEKIFFLATVFVGTAHLHTLRSGGEPYPYLAGWTRR